MNHPLLDTLLAAAAGAFPPVDGGVTHLPPLEDGLEAIVSFTGHAFLASRLTADDIADLAPDGFGSVLHPSVLLRMAGDRGDIAVGVIDVTLVAPGTGAGAGAGGMEGRTDLDDHPRVRHARSLRSDVEVFGDESGLVTVARGLAGRREMSIELFDTSTSRGEGRRLIESTLGMVGGGEPVFAGVSPGNARSLRAFLACGFTPIGSEVIVKPARAAP
ncbi:MAG: hypothetical protein ACFCVC_00825 [Acidimicrobiia bacterium]